nr:Serine/threonine-protein kinase par-1 [Polyrhizophydium stewartii]
MLARKRLLGEYNLGKTIGQGAFSKVKIASHRETGEKVAIKVIDKKLMEEKAKKSKAAHEERERKRQLEELRRARAEKLANKEASAAAAATTTQCRSTPAAPKQDSNPSFISTMQKEVQLMMRLDHPHIIKIFQVLETEEECFIVMEYAKGGELIDYIAARDHLTEKEARKFFRQILSALDHCHMANVVHRDLKLENLLLNHERNVLVSDFGLGRTFDPDANEYMKTFCGTPNYAAVELISGIPYVGVKSDIWAMGVVLYIMMTGRPPFVGETISLLYRQIKAVDYKVPSYFSEDLVDLLRKILVRDPAARIDMEGIRSHPWVNYEYIERPLRIAPKVTGVVDTATLSQVISSIYYDKTYVVYVFRRHDKLKGGEGAARGAKDGQAGADGKAGSGGLLSVSTFGAQGRSRRSSFHNDMSRESYARRKSITFATGGPAAVAPMPAGGKDGSPNTGSGEFASTASQGPPGLTGSGTRAGSGRRHSLFGAFAGPTQSDSHDIHGNSGAVGRGSQGRALSHAASGSGMINQVVHQMQPTAPPTLQMPTASRRPRRMSLQETARTRYAMQNASPREQEMSLSIADSRAISPGSSSPLDASGHHGGSGLDVLAESRNEDPVIDRRPQSPESAHAARVQASHTRSMTSGQLALPHLMQPDASSSSSGDPGPHPFPPPSLIGGADKQAGASRTSVFSRRRMSSISGSLRPMLQTNAGRRSFSEDDRSADILRRMSAVSPMLTPTAVTAPVDDMCAGILPTPAMVAFAATGVLGSPATAADPSGSSAHAPWPSSESEGPESNGSDFGSSMLNASGQSTSRAMSHLRGRLARDSSSASVLGVGGPLTPVGPLTTTLVVGTSHAQHGFPFPSSVDSISGSGGNAAAHGAASARMPVSNPGSGSSTAARSSSQAIHEYSRSPPTSTGPKPIEDIQLSMREIEEWHLTHKPPKEVRAMRFSFNRATTSSVLDPSTMFQDVHRALLTVRRCYSNNLRFSRTPDYYMFQCEFRDPSNADMTLDFEVEICKVWLLKMHGARIKRTGGSVFLFKDIYWQLVNELHWE